ncbi:MAG: tetratricopeptide repeat protein [Verrucomicrobia bacterium]|nr:tetratricopeptide repeat protein [Verrucomicrobiota bacterium]
MIRLGFPPLRFVLASLLLACVGALPASPEAHPAKPEAKTAQPAEHAAPTHESPAAAGAQTDHPAPPAAQPTPSARESVAPAAPAPSADHPTAKVAAPAKPASAKPAAGSPEEVRSLLKLGAALTDRADYGAAEIAFHQVINDRTATTDDLKSGLLGLARMHRKQGAFTKAVAIYERYLKDHPSDERVPDALLDLGRTLRALGIHKVAISRFYSVLNSTLKLDGNSFEHYQLLAKTAQFEIAQTHFEAGEFAEANKFFTRLRLLDLAPADRARAHFMSAYSQRLQGDREVAVTTLRAFVEQSPDDENIPEARYLLAITLRELKRPQEAFAATLELLRAEKTRTATDPKRWAYWQRRTGNQLANDFFETGDTLNAHSIYSGLLELSVEPSWRLPLTYQIALCYERLGTLDRARVAYQSIVEALGPTPAAELAELSKMAAWRLDHLRWKEKTEQQVTAMFTTTTGKQALATPPPVKPDGATAAPAPALPGKTASTP